MGRTMSGRLAVVGLGPGDERYLTSEAAAALADAQALYGERGTMAEEKMIPLTAKPDDDAPYFAVVLVPGWTQRPGATPGGEPGGER